MKEEDGTVGSRRESTKELVASEADSLGIVVLVSERLDPNVPEDREMVCYFRGNLELDVFDASGRKL